MSPRPDDAEQRLRDLFDHAVDDIEPRPGLDAIQSRTKVTPMSSRPWFLGVGAAVVATAATIVAFAVVGDDPGKTTTSGEPAGGPSTVATSPTIEESPSPTASQSSGSEGGAAIPVYYVGETGQGPRLYREFHGGPANNPLQAAVEQGVSRAPDDPDYTTPWPAGTDVESSFDGVGDDGEIGVALTSPDGSSLATRPAGMSKQTAQMAVQQLVYTAQAATQTTAPVQFRLDGERTDQVLGVPTAKPVSRADETSTLALVWIIDPAQGAVLDSGFEVSGVGAFFEANVVWELHAGDERGKVVASSAKSGPVTAKECCTMAPYSFTVEAPPGDYTLVVHDSDPSGGEGAPPFEDSKQITVR